MRARTRERESRGHWSVRSQHAAPRAAKCHAIDRTDGAGSRQSTHLQVNARTAQSTQLQVNARTAQSTHLQVNASTAQKHSLAGKC